MFDVQQSHAGCDAGWIQRFHGGDTLRDNHYATESYEDNAHIVIKYRSIEVDTLTWARFYSGFGTNLEPTTYFFSNKLSRR